MPLPEHNEKELQQLATSSYEEMRNHILRDDTNITDKRRMLQNAFASSLLYLNPSLAGKLLTDFQTSVTTKYQGVVDDIFSTQNLENQKNFTRTFSPKQAQNLPRKPADLRQALVESCLETSVQQRDYIRKRLFQGNQVFSALLGSAKSEARRKEMYKESRFGYDWLASLAKQTDVCHQLANLTSEPKELFDKRLKESFNTMRATGAKSSQSRFELMMDAMRKATFDELKGNENRTPEQKARDIATAIARTQDYLADKKKVRWGKVGKIRFQCALTFLSTVMPEAEFKEYCDGINQKRGVQEGHKDYVDPKTFKTDYKPPESKINAKNVAEYFAQEANKRDMALVDKMAVKDYEEKSKKAFEAYLKKSHPSAHKKWQNRIADIKSLEKTDPERYKLKKKKCEEDLTKMAVEWMRREEKQKERREIELIEDVSIIYFKDDEDNLNIGNVNESLSQEDELDIINTNTKPTRKNQNIINTNTKPTRKNQNIINFQDDVSVINYQDEDELNINGRSSLEDELDIINKDEDALDIINTNTNSKRKQEEEFIFNTNANPQPIQDNRYIDKGDGVLYINTDKDVVYNDPLNLVFHDDIIYPKTEELKPPELPEFLELPKRNNNIVNPKPQKVTEPQKRNKNIVKPKTQKAKKGPKKGSGGPQVEF